MVAVRSPEAGAPERTAVRPASRLVRLAALIALCALAAVVWHLLVAPVLALATIAAALTLLDWGISGNDPPPRLERILADAAPPVV